MSCPLALLARAVAPCSESCAEGGPSVIKRSPRLSWLSKQPDVEQRVRGFFSQGACLGCVADRVAEARLPSSCATVSLKLLSRAMPSAGPWQAAYNRDKTFLFWTMQCTSQCLHLLSSSSRASCYCRACRTLPDWRGFERFCAVLSPPDLPECRSLSPHLNEACPLAPAAVARSTPIETIALPMDEYAVRRTSPSLSDTDAAACRTAFNTSCCPAPKGAVGSPPCGGPARGTCVPVTSWLAAQAERGQLTLESHPSCSWPAAHGGARCLCHGNFAGDDCGGCARGFMGERCDVTRPREVRRSASTLNYADAVKWASVVRGALHGMPRPLAFADENEIELIHEFSRTFHASGWLNHFHILYFEAWLEAVRRDSQEYSAPWWWFDPSDRATLRKFNGFIEHHHRSSPMKHGAAAMPPALFPEEKAGNLPPPTVALLTEHLGRYFPPSAGYSTELFLPNGSTTAELRDALAAEEAHGQHKTGHGQQHPKAEARGEAKAEAKAGAGGQGVGKVLPGTFSAYFQRLHAVHQTVLVGGGPISGGGGPCTPGVQHGFASEGDLACLPLAPSHAFYDKLLRDWMARHGHAAACDLRVDDDLLPETCVPYLIPLTRLKDLCDPEREGWYVYE